MGARHWLSQLRSELEQRKLPSDYIARLVAELSDHLVDVLEDPMSTDAKDLHGVFQRLGEPGHVAAHAAKEYRKGRFSRRHPVVMFVVLPLVALPPLWLACVLALVLTIKALGLESGSPAIGGPVWQWANECLPFVVVAMLLLPAAVAAALFCRLATRAAVNWKWTLAASFLVAAVAGMAGIQFYLPSAVSQGRLMLGFGISLRPSASQILQFLLPMSIGAWAVWRQIKNRPGQAVHA